MILEVYERIDDMIKTVRTSEKLESDEDLLQLKSSYEADIVTIQEKIEVINLKIGTKVKGEIL